MSADDGVYIHKFRNGWKVVHTQAIENIHYKAGSDGYNHRILYSVFSGSPLFKTQVTAWKFAKKLYKEAVDDFGYVEYGIKEV